MPRKRVTLLIFAICSVALFGSVAFFLQNKELQKEAGDISNAHWQKQIENMGATTAYERFKEQAKKSDSPHLEAHKFGGALYETKGIAGIEVCDASFAYGCYHELTGRAVNDRGKGALPEANAQCRESENFLSCQHGIGHGILSVTGYKRDALISALDTCASLADADTIGGCIGGVFMEYNLRTMLSIKRKEGSSLRTLPDENVYAPCDTLSKTTHQEACYFWQPQLWIQNMFEQKDGYKTILQTVTNRCMRLKNTAYRNRCVEGLGNAFVGELSRRKIQHTNVASDICKYLPTGSDRYRCIVHAAGAFIGNEDSRTKAAALCGSLPEEKEVSCREKAGLTP